MRYGLSYENKILTIGTLLLFSSLITACNKNSDDNKLSDLGKESQKNPVKESFGRGTEVVKTPSLTILVNNGKTRDVALFTVMPARMTKTCFLSGFLVSNQKNAKELFQVPIISLNAGFDGIAVTFMVESEGIDMLQKSKLIAVNVCDNWVRLNDNHIDNIKKALN